MNDGDLMRLSIKGVAAKGTHGVNQDEKIYPQTFKVDLTVWFSGLKAIASDDLVDTVNYSTLQKTIVRVIKRTHFNLIEALASTILDEVLLSDLRISQASIKLHKPEAPLKLPFEDVSVEISRMQKNNG